MYKNSIVIHKKFGKGTVKNIVNGSNCKFINIRFKNKEAQFIFPDAFEKHLQFEDEDLQAAVMEELYGRNDAQAPVESELSTDLSISNNAVALPKSRQKKTKRAGDAKTGIYILNFQAPSSFDELLWAYEQGDKKTNLELLLDDVKTGITGWSVPTYAEVGDTILFMLASSSIDTYHLKGAINEAAALQEWKVYDYGTEEREKYRKYAGKILCVGKIKSFPQEDGYVEMYNQRLIFAEIGDLQMLENQVHYKEFKDYISINRFGSVTGVKQDQWDKLKELLLIKNPGLCV